MQAVLNKEPPGHNYVDTFFVLSSLTEVVSSEYAKTLGIDGKLAEIFGYVTFPKNVDRQILDKIKSSAVSTFGNECQFLPVHPHDTLPQHVRHELRAYRKDNPTMCCILYKTN